MRIVSAPPRPHQCPLPWDRGGYWTDWPKERQPYRWDDPDLIVMEVDLTDDRRDNESGYYTLPRSNLRAFCDRLENGPDPADLLVFHIYEDDS